jgi:hypothetical protein
MEFTLEAIGDGSLSDEAITALAALLLDAAEGSTEESRNYAELGSTL